MRIVFSRKGFSAGGGQEFVTDIGGEREPQRWLDAIIAEIE